MFFELLRQQAEKEAIATKRKHAGEQVVSYRLRSQAQALPQGDLFSIVRRGVEACLLTKYSPAESNPYQLVIGHTGRMRAFPDYPGAVMAKINECLQDILLSSTVVTHTDIKPVFMTAMGRLRITSTEATRKANTDPTALQIQLTVPEWWSQVVYVYGPVEATRKSLVLGAANKDGGAHVDTKLTKEYESLMMGGLRGWFHYSPTSDGRFQPAMNEHFLYIRQMGFELLNSPELLALTA
jgi:hypothetical protein